MAMPDGIGGSQEKKGPGISLTVVDLGRKRRMPDGIGGQQSSDEDEESMGEPISAEQARIDAAKEIISVVTAMKPDSKRLDQALYAYVKACSSDNDEGSE